MTIKEQLQEKLDAIATELEDVALGRGEYADEYEAQYLDEDGELESEYLDCVCDQQVYEATRYEQLREYFDGILDVQFVIGGRGDYRGVVLMLAYGGPTVYFDTSKYRVRDYVTGIWGCDKAEAVLDRKAAQIIDEYWQEQAELLFDMP